MFKFPTILKVPDHFARLEKERRALEKRNLEKAKSLGWIEGDPYTAKEIVALHEIHCSLVEEHFFRFAPGGAFWQATQGHAANLSVSPVLRMADDANKLDQEENKDGLSNLLERIGAHMAIAIRENDAELFHQLSVILSYRRDGKRLSDISLKELRVRSTRGRKPSPVDLSRTFPIAIIKVTGNRLDHYYLEGEWTKEKITRAEIGSVVRQWGGTISESEMSRWISKFKFGPFMAEQPIARKRPKRAN